MTGLNTGEDVPGRVRDMGMNNSGKPASDT